MSSENPIAKLEGMTATTSCLLTTLRGLRSAADRAPRVPGDKIAGGGETRIEGENKSFFVRLEKSVLDREKNIFCYVVFIRGAEGAHSPSDQFSELICRGIYDVESKEGPLKYPGMRWFIRVRVEQPTEHFAP